MVVRLFWGGGGGFIYEQRHGEIRTNVTLNVEIGWLRLEVALLGAFQPEKSYKKDFLHD